MFNSLVTKYGLVAVFALMTAESCGIPIPSEVVVPLGGVLAAGGRWNVVTLAVTAAAAELVGALIAYGVAARWGEALLLGPGRYVGIRRHHVEMADRWFQRYGLPAVFFGRLLPAVRTYISFPAGLARVPLARFAVFTFAGSLLWDFGLALAGFELGRNFDRIASFLRAGGYLLGLALVLAVVAWWWRGRRSESPQPAD